MNKALDVIVIAVFLLVLSFGFWWLVSPSKEMILVKASFKGDTNLILKLANEGANINWTSKQTGKTALMMAASHGQDGAVKTLLELGADKKIKDHEGKTAEDYALSGGWTNSARVLLNP